MIIFTKDTLRAGVEAASGGLVTVLYDDLGYPSYMYVVPKFNIEDVVGDNSIGTGVHPMFIVNGREVPEIFVGQFQASVVNNRAVSWPGVDPTASINFETSISRCAAKGTGWHLMTNAEWAGVALWTFKAHGNVRGNTDYGRSHEMTYEMGRRQDGLAPGLASGTARTLTGSGPASWRHNGQPFGISDLVGNIWEWNAGLRIVNGEIQIIANNDAAENQLAVHAVDSASWKALLEDGSLVAPGTTDTLKWDATGESGAGAPILNTEVTSQSDGTTSASAAFDSVAAADDVIGPDILKQLLIFPITDTTIDGSLYVKNVDERLPYRGGDWYGGGNAGLAAACLYFPRSYAGTSFGFRPAFVA